MDGSLFLSFLSVFFSLIALILSISILIIKAISTQQAPHCHCHCHCSRSVIPAEKQNISGGDVVEQPQEDQSQIEDISGGNVAEEPQQEQSQIEPTDEEEASTEEIVIDPKQMGLTFHDAHWAWEWIAMDRPGYNIVAAPAGGVSQDGSIAQVLRFRGDCGYPVQGNCDMSLLAPNKKYEASVVLMITKPVAGLLHLELVPAGGNKYVDDVEMAGRAMNQWFTIPLGDFTVPSVAAGAIKFEMVTGKLNNGGLVLKGVDIHPARS